MLVITILKLSWGPNDFYFFGICYSYSCLWRLYNIMLDQERGKYDSIQGYIRVRDTTKRGGGGGGQGYFRDS